MTSQNHTPCYWAFINVVHYCGKQRAKTTDGIRRRFRRAGAAFRLDLERLLREQGLPQDAIRIISIDDEAEVVTIRSGRDVVHVVKSLPGVLDVMPQGRLRYYRPASSSTC